jgi:hypothetical protein
MDVSRHGGLRQKYQRNENQERSQANATAVVPQTTGKKSHSWPQLIPHPKWPRK